ncbi:MAG: peptidylprolyl isomerase [Alphaproteobacteria bacterium]|nr:peptidylprolyl isomerase [Alphaproteobacteria bacterium]
MKKFMTATMLALMACVPAYTPACADDAGMNGSGDTIAAVVNDSVITTVDLDQRMTLAILSSGLPDNDDVRSHLLPQILRAMIDEQLEVQEAHRLDLSVSDSEVDAALDKIAHDNNIQGGMRAFIAARGGSPDALATQVRDALLWNKVVQRELRPKVEIGDDEIDAVIARQRANAGKQEFLLSEIFLPVENAHDDGQVHDLAEKLLGQLRNGANFPAVARQFSQSADAAQGGDMGWIQRGQLPPELDRALNGAAPGEISDPIRAADGYYILGVRDHRTVSVGDGTVTLELTQAFHPYNAANKDAVMADAARLRHAFKSCTTLNATAAAFPGWTIQKLGAMDPAKAPPWLAATVRDVAAGGSSAPLATNKGAAILFVCGRSEGDQADRNAILQSIGTEKMELQARGLLRDLRRNAYIDIRLGKHS